MDRRDFLKAASLFGISAFSTLSGVSKVLDIDKASNRKIGFKENDMERRAIGGMNVSAIGLGCLPMVGYYGGKLTAQK